MSEYAIVTDKLTKSYGKGRGIFNIDLKVKKGKVFGLVGRNGAGKTTLIKILMGLIQSDRGEASILDMDFSEKNYEILSYTGFVDEEKTLYKWMTVKEIIRFTKGFYKSWDDILCSDLIKEFEIDKDQKISSLSRGMRAELSLILALSFHPRLLILDEPTSGLDIMVRHEFLEKFIVYACKEETTILFSSHILEDVERISDEIAFIDKGKLLFQAGIEEIRSQYRNYLAEQKKETAFNLKDVFISVVKNEFSFRKEECDG
ncbi:ABC transporter ATP-binding protein [bacterium]|nr:ABC transporter ATP-binding protein [bacterium]